jgi:hypothetical protein
MRKLPMCPPATQDIRTNLENRKKAIMEAKYGPPNPNLPNDKYWESIAEEWGVEPDEARTMLCGNCAAFDVTQHMLDCIAKGIAQGVVDAVDRQLADQLGYCRFFKFKCAASRTCSAWVTGGPITDE